MAQLVSLVVPLFNEEECLPLLQRELAAVADRIEREKGLRVEIVMVDDGSIDGSWLQVVDFARADPRVRAVSFSRNFGHQAALSCGYGLAAGDAVVTLDADLQDPPEVVLELIDAWQQGADIVYAVRERREGETLFKRWSAEAFYRLLQWFTHDVSVPHGWMGLQMSIITFGSLTLICIGIMGEYVGRIYEWSYNRPLFLIRERLNLGDGDARTGSPG